jgi:hypothetical protein
MLISFGSPALLSCYAPIGMPAMLDDLGHEPGPAGLTAGAQQSPIVSVEVFTERTLRRFRQRGFFPNDLATRFVSALDTE